MSKDSELPDAYALIVDLKADKARLAAHIEALKAENRDQVAATVALNSRIEALQRSEKMMLENTIQKAARIEALEAIVAAKQNILLCIRRSIVDHLDAEVALASGPPRPGDRGRE